MMTTITLEKDKNKHTITADGHATGSVEVCAAVSVLMYSFAGYLQEIGALLSLEIEDAHFSISFMGCDAISDLARCAFSQIEASYGEYLKIS